MYFLNKSRKLGTYFSLFRSTATFSNSIFSRAKVVNYEKPIFSTTLLSIHPLRELGLRATKVVSEIVDLTTTAATQVVAKKV